MLGQTVLLKVVKKEQEQIRTMNRLSEMTIFEEETEISHTNEIGTTAHQNFETSLARNRWRVTGDVSVHI
jgi:hypothetical protein